MRHTGPSRKLAKLKSQVEEAIREKNSGNLASLFSAVCSREARLKVELEQYQEYKRELWRRLQSRLEKKIGKPKDRSERFAGGPFTRGMP